jgi:MFS family permease
MLSDYISRQVLNATFPALKAEWALSDTQLGALVSVVALAVGVLSFPVSLMADRWGRVKSVSLMALLWSVATIGCGLSGNYAALFTARAAVGVGEAGYSSAGGAILVSVFPRRLHGTIINSFLSAALFGSVAGLVLGGALAQQHGWRTAFYIIGAGGLVLSLLYVAGVRETGPVRSQVAAPLPVKDVLKRLLTTKTALWTYLGSGLMMFIQGALLAWMPSLMNRYYGFDMTRAGTTTGLLVIAGGVGMIAGGALVDYLSARRGVRRLRIMVGFALCYFALLFLAFQLPPGNAQLLAIAAAFLTGSAFVGTSGVIVTAVSPAAIHASAFAMLTLGNNILGYAPGPFVVGVLADNFGLRTAMQVLPFVGLAAAAAFLIADRNYDRDVQDI